MTTFIGSRITVGNALFALNRCGVQQLVEYIFYRWNIEGPVPDAGRRDYVNDLAKYVLESFQTGDIPKGIRQHTELRVSTGFLLLTLSEAALVFSCSHSNSSKLTGHILWVVILCVAALGAYVWQFWVTRRIDYLRVKNVATSHADKVLEDR